MFNRVKSVQVLTCLVALVACSVPPMVTNNQYVLHVLILSMIFAIFASSWNLVTGFAGLKTFGHHAFFGIAAYSSALLSMNLGVSPWLSLLFAVAIAGMAGVAIGLPVLRLKSMPHVAIVTLGFGEIVRIVVSNLQAITRGELGLWGIPTFPAVSIPFLGEVSFISSEKASFFYLSLFLLVVSQAVIITLMRSRIGLSLVAIRDAEDAAESLGINLARLKLLVFGLSAALSGLAGTLYAHYLLVLTPSAAIAPDLMILAIAMCLVGGLGTFSGPIVGALVLTILIEALRDLGSFRMIAYGALIIGVVVYMPKGLVSLRMPAKRLVNTKETELVAR